MKTRKKRSNLIGRLLFFVPMIIIISVVIYAFLTVTAPGTLMVQAQGYNKYLPQGHQTSSLQVSYSVIPSLGGKTISGTTPATLSLPSGTYTVEYGQAQWYLTPASKTIQTPSGITSYAVGVYDVIPDVVAITAQGFNATQVQALHQVTPVIWINNSSQSVTLNVSPVGPISLATGANFTEIFQAAGSYQFATGSNINGTVTVS